MKKNYIDVEKLTEGLKSFETEDTGVYVVGLCCYSYSKDKSKNIFNDTYRNGYFNVSLDPYVVELDDSPAIESTSESSKKPKK